MEKCKWKKYFLTGRCKEEIYAEGASYCFNHGCSYLCVLRNLATRKTSFGKNTCDKCFDLAEKEHKRTQEEKRQIIKKQRLKKLQESNDAIIAAIENASSDFWQIIKEVFEKINDGKKTMVERVRKWDIYENSLYHYTHFIDDSCRLLTAKEKNKWKKVYFGVILSYDNFEDFLIREKDLLVSLAQERKLKEEEEKNERLRKETEEKERERERETNWKNYLTEISSLPANSRGF